MWNTLAETLKHRQGKQCRERWFNQLNPLLVPRGGPWQEDEEWVLFLMSQVLGRRWSHITEFILGRSDNAIKNHWNYQLKGQRAADFDKALYRKLDNERHDHKDATEPWSRDQAI